MHEVLEVEKTDSTVSSSWYSHPQMRNALLAGLLTGLAIVLTKVGILNHTTATLLYIPAIVLGGYAWAREGIEEFFEDRKIDIELLMLAAAVGSAALGLWEEAALLVFIYGAAEGLESYTFAKTRASIRKLLELAPKEARLLKNGKESTVSAESLEVGDIFLVKPGESIATDGLIVSGASSIDESPITGESIPVEKHNGMQAFAASINQEGALEIKVTATYANNTLAKMVHMVEEAQDKKSKAQMFIDRFGSKYSPVILVVGLLLIALPPLFGLNFSEWATRAIVFLVAAAPCALVMSTPVAIAAGIGKAGRSGILIKGGIHLENLGKIKAVAFDKTGTLTKGKPVVTDIETVRGSKADLLSMAAAVEQLSDHPLARAITSKAKDQKLSLQKATNFKSLTAAGARATVKGSVTVVGKYELFADKDGDFVQRMENLRDEGKTVIYVGTERELLGAIALRDEIRPGAKEIISKLHAMGITVAMLTGDNMVTAKAIAKELGVDDVRADLKPEDKIAAVKQLQQRYGGVAMVGDGVNDAPALATATVGMAMGTAGTDAAIEAADVALMADDLGKVAYAITLGQAAQGISRQNIIFSMLLLAVLIPSALIGALTITIAVLVHEVGELLAIGNGLRVAIKQPTATNIPIKERV
jgi:Zn2+/Cd2+-exporting ATPase